VSTAAYVDYTILWLLFAVVGTISSVVNVYERIQDTRALWTAAHTWQDHVWYIFGLRGSLLRLLTTLFFVGSGGFQLSFPPIVPHMANNYYRTFGTMGLMLLYVVINLADSLVRRFGKHHHR
jgi:hypothetical protein